MSMEGRSQGKGSILAEPSVIDMALDITQPVGEAKGRPDETLGLASSNLNDGLCGQTLHHFRVLSLIGHGGMGTVYRAHDLSLDRMVALKVIRSQGMNSTARERFLREARAQASLSHPNVVPIYYIGEQEDFHFFAMELVEGEALEACLVRGEHLNHTRVLDHMTAVAKALRQAHQRGLTHRDIKPSNLLLDEAGAVKVADFGLAKRGGEDVRITQEGVVMGTPLYMSPEQAKGEPTDHRSDIYSLGATFYHLLVGDPPFNAQTPLGVITKHITQPLPSLRCLVPEAPDELVTVVERCLEKDPARRFQSYDELIDALEAARPLEVAPAGFWVRAMALGADMLLLLVVGALVQDLIWLIYPIYVVGGWWLYGRTVGKWIFRLRVRTQDNLSPSLRRCAWRFLWFNWGVLAMMTLGGIHRLAVGSWDIPFPFKGGYFTSLNIFFGLATLAILLFYLASFVRVGLRRDHLAFHDQASATHVVYQLSRKG